jgi:hypothetical protein
MTKDEALATALELLAVATFYSPDSQAKRTEVIAAGLKALSQDVQEPLNKGARTIGLSLDDWEKIGCVNHDCDQCKAAAPVQEPTVWVRPNGINNSGVAHYGPTCPPGWVGAATAYFKAPAQPAPVPDGWKLVPVEPTREMWTAVNKLDDQMAAGNYDGKGCSIEQAWNCLLDASPTPPAAQRQWVKLNWLPEHKCGLHLSHNEHRDVYETIEQFYDADDFISPDEWHKALAEDSVWVLHLTNKQTDIETLEVENRLLRARNERLEREAISQDVQEPEVDLRTRWPMNGWKENKATPPAAQPQWIGLTYAEKNELRYSHMTSAEFIDAIEAKLKEKNEPANNDR